MAQKKTTNPYVGIAGSLGGSLIAITALIVIFASSNAWILAPVALCVALMGLGLGYFASKK